MLRPMSPAFTELWLDGEKAATVEWRKNVDAVPGLDVDTEMAKDNGRGIVVDHPVEPLYGDIYLPRESLLCTYIEIYACVFVFLYVQLALGLFFWGIIACFVLF